MGSGDGQYLPGNSSQKPTRGETTNPTPVAPAKKRAGFVAGVITGVAASIFADAGRDLACAPHVQNTANKATIDHDAVEVPNMFGYAKGKGSVYIYRDSAGFKRIRNITISPTETKIDYNDNQTKVFENASLAHLNIRVVGEGKDTDKPILIHLVNTRDNGDWEVSLPNEIQGIPGALIDMRSPENVSTGNKVIFDVSKLQGKTTIANDSENTLLIDGLNNLDREKLKSVQKTKALQREPSYDNKPIIFDSNLTVTSGYTSVTGFKTVEKTADTRVPVNYLPDDYTKTNTDYSLIGKGYYDSFKQQPAQQAGIGR